LYGTRSQENEIQLDFSQSPQRVELHFFLKEQLFLHAKPFELSSNGFTLLLFSKE